MRSWLVAGWLALTVGSCTREAALTSRGGDLDADAGDAGFGAAFVSAGAGAKAGTVGSAPPSGSSAGGSAERLDNLGGSSTPGPSAGATSELPAAGALGGWMTEEEWAAASGVYEGKHTLSARGCPSERIGREYLIAPTVSCRVASDYDFDTNPIRICDVEPFCTGPEDCTEAAFGSCQAATYALCDYGLEWEPCTADSDCRTLPGGRCLTEREMGHDVPCYPTGECDTREPRCDYPEQPCETDADCPVAPGGTCAKRAYYARCSYNDCMTESDCATGHRCACSERFDRNQCVPADCFSDDSCPSGRSCRLEYGCLGDVVGYHCSTPEDTCATADDCAGAVCEFVAAHWQCREYACPMTP